MISLAVIDGFAATCAAVLLVYLIYALLFAEEF